MCVCNGVGVYLYGCVSVLYVFGMFMFVYICVCVFLDVVCLLARCKRRKGQKKRTRERDKMYERKERNYIKLQDVVIRSYRLRQVLGSRMNLNCLNHYFFFKFNLLTSPLTPSPPRDGAFDEISKVGVSFRHDR